MVLKRLSTAQKEEEENKIDDLKSKIAPEKPEVSVLIIQDDPFIQWLSHKYRTGMDSLH